MPQSSCTGDMIGSCGTISGMVLVVATGVFGGSLAVWAVGGNGSLLAVILALALGVGLVPESFPWGLVMAVPLALLYRRTLGGPSIDACYTPALTAKTGKSRAGSAMKRARDGVSRACTTDQKVARELCGRRPIERHEEAPGLFVWPGPR